MTNRRGGAFWRTFITGAAGAVAFNSTIYAAGRAAGVDFIVTSDGRSTSIPYPQVAVMSAIPVLVGAGVLLLARRRARLVELIAATLTLLSLGAPLTMSSDARTAMALAAMHVVAGAAFGIAAGRTRGRLLVAGPRRHRTPRSASPSPSM